jgi:hypothetical protein
MKRIRNEFQRQSVFEINQMSEYNKIVSLAEKDVNIVTASKEQIYNEFCTLVRLAQKQNFEAFKKHDLDTYEKAIEYFNNVLHVQETLTSENFAHMLSLCAHVLHRNTVTILDPYNDILTLKLCNEDADALYTKGYCELYISITKGVKAWWKTVSSQDLIDVVNDNPNIHIYIVKGSILDFPRHVHNPCGLLSVLCFPIKLVLRILRALFCVMCYFRCPQKF